MKLLSCLLLFAVVAMSQGEIWLYDVNDAPSLFEKFMKAYDRHYKDEADKQEHYKAFVSSLRKLNTANKAFPTIKFEVDMFSDYTPEENQKMFGLKLPEFE